MAKYLTTDTQSTYIDVVCDGFVARIYSDGSRSYLGEILDPNNLSTVWMRFGSKLDVGGTIYAISEDTGISVTLKEDTSIRVVIKISGDFEDSGQSSLADESGSELWLYIHPTKIVQHIKFNTTASITINDSVSNGICFMDSVAANITNEDSKYENSGTETDAGSSGAQNSAKYIATLSDEINVIGALSEESAPGTTTFNQYISDPGDALRFGWNNGDATAASTMTVIWQIDSADRENDNGTFNEWVTANAYDKGTILLDSTSNLRYIVAVDNYTSDVLVTDATNSYIIEYRMTLGNQYDDQILSNPLYGNNVIDLGIPVSISGSTRRATDDADHFETAVDKKVSYTNDDKPRINHVNVIENHPIETGTVAGAVDHVVGHWKMDDTQGDTFILIDETGNNNGTLEGGDYPLTLTRSDTVRGSSLLFNGIDDYANLNTGWVALTSKEKFTIMFDFKPNFSYNVGTYQGLITIANSSSDQIPIIYDYSNKRFWILDDINNGNASYLFGPTFTSDNQFQQWRHFVLSVDISKQILCIELDGVVVLVKSIVNSSWGTTPTTFNIGREFYHTSTYGSYYIDNVKLIDGCLLPYGSFFTGNNGIVDTDITQDEISLYWSGFDCTGTNIEVGAIQGTKGGTGGTFQTTGGIFNDDYFDTEGTADLHFPVTSSQFNPNEGLFSKWINIQTISDGDVIFGVGDNNDYIQATMDSNGNVDVVYQSDSTAATIVGDIALGTGEWHHLWVGYDDTEKLTCKIDGVLNGTAQDIANAWDGTTSLTFYLGADYEGNNISDIFISHVYLGKKKYTYQNPIILDSGPLHTLIQRIS